MKLTVLAFFALCSLAHAQLSVTHGISGSASFANGQIATPSSTSLFTSGGLSVLRLLSFFYVDSAASDDTGNGLTPATPKKTLAATQALIGANGGTVFLKRGSNWREQFNIPANNVAVTVYGSGDMPIIDGTDVAGEWTQPDAVTYPNVWSQSWTRTSATTGAENTGLWEDGVRPRYATNATTDLQDNGGWHCSNLTAQTSTISINAAADPNSDGILREITKRHYGIAGHSVTLGATRTGQTVNGPIEFKRCVGHYNAYSGGPGIAQRMLLRDGTIHHTVSEGDLIDIIATEIDPNTVGGSPITQYRAVGTGFAPMNTRVLSLYPGGADRKSLGAFTAHSSSPAVADSHTLISPMVRGSYIGGGGYIRKVEQGAYAEDWSNVLLDAGVSNLTVKYLLTRDTTVDPAVNGNPVFRRLSTDGTITATHCATVNRKAAYFTNIAGGTKPVLHNNAAISLSSAAGISAGEADLRYSILHIAGRVLTSITTSYTGDYNVFYTVGVAAPEIHYNGVFYNSFTAPNTSLAQFQAASGQDANSVYLKHADQVSGNGIAFWLGLASGENLGPVDGDFRINPSAKVYKGDGTALTGLFADGVTPITQAGPQFHWNWNTRSVSAGPPTRHPVLPTSIAEMRTYVESPETWNFYL